MPDLAHLLIQHPFWAWLALGAALLAAEALTGTGWLLWPAVSAGVTAAAILTGKLDGLPLQAAVFAGLTIASTLAARPWLSKPRGKGDINDRAHRVLGQTGEVRANFISGHGRVFVDGAEWPAELEGGGELAAGQRVKVVKVRGARLVVSAS